MQGPFLYHLYQGCLLSLKVFGEGFPEVLWNGLSMRWLHVLQEVFEAGLPFTKKHVDSFHVYYMDPSEIRNRSPYWDVCSSGYT